jgi:hypothetical protein
MERECGGCPLLLQHAAPSSGDVDSIFANRMQMAGITPHDRIGKTLHKLWYKKKKKKLLLLVFGCLQNKEKLLLSRNPRKKPLYVIASASSDFSPRTSSISLFCFGFVLLLNEKNVFFSCFGFFAAIAVSGGPDSMALCILTARWWQQQQQVKGLSHSVIEEAAAGMMMPLLSNHVVGMVVDHGLRPESAMEALSVQHWLARLGEFFSLSAP